MTQELVITVIGVILLATGLILEKRSRTWRDSFVISFFIASCVIGGFAAVGLEIMLLFLHLMSLLPSANSKIGPGFVVTQELVIFIIGLVILPLGYVLIRKARQRQESDPSFRFYHDNDPGVMGCAGWFLAIIGFLIVALTVGGNIYFWIMTLPKAY